MRYGSRSREVVIASGMMVLANMMHLHLVAYRAGFGRLLVEVER
jgi:hypothetical protein